MAEHLCLGCMEKVNDKYDVCPYCGYDIHTPAKEAYHIPPGTVLEGKYIVGQVIGYGGFGVTYIGYDGLFEKKIAIKEYLPSEFATRMPGQTEVTIYSGDREEQFNSGIEKFIDEAKRLAQFKDVPGIVHIFDSFMENKTAYIVMEYLEGETLKSRIQRDGKLSVDTSLDIMQPILTALCEVHKIGIIHRDIAPDNIFLCKNGDVKLLDFGAARYATTTHSKSLSVIIKQGYAPEEQYRSRGDQGPWTDVYACGATLYKMLTGITPEDSMERAGKDTLVPPSKKGAKSSKNLDTAIMNAMNVRIEDRTQSADEFRAELYEISEVKRKKVSSRKADIGRWPLGLKIGLGSLAAAVVAFIVLLTTGVIHFDVNVSENKGLLAMNEAYVPNVINYTVADAEEKVNASELVLQIIDKQNSDTIPKDLILSQSIDDGVVVQMGSTLEIIVSAGGEVVYLEDLSGMDREDAIELLDSMGLKVEFEEEASEVAPGCIIRYEVSKDGKPVDAALEIEKGSTVKIYVSKGLEDIDENQDTTVPNVVGMTYEAATTATKNAKLYIYKIKSEYSATVPKGQIIEQNVTANSKVKQGERLGVVVSLGKQFVRVPDVQYKSSSEAISILSNSQLTYEVRNEDSDSVAKDHVIRQSVAPGTEVDMQSVVVIYVSNGNPNAYKVPSQVASTASTEKSTTVANNSSSEKSTEATSNSDKKPASTSEKASESSSEKPASTTTEATTEFVQEDPNKGKCEVPNLVGSSQSLASTSLSNAKLTVGSVEYRSSTSKSTGTVLAQGIEPGTKVAKNTAVNLIVCDNSTNTITEYRQIIETKEYKDSSSSSMSGWTRLGYVYGDYGSTKDNGTSWIDEKWDTDMNGNSVKVREVWRGDIPYDFCDGQRPRTDRDFQNGYYENVWIQCALNFLGGENLAHDGIFGENTKAAVRRYQARNGLSQDGIPGRNTVSKMIEQVEASRHYYYHERTKTYKYERTNTTYGDWTRTMPSGKYETRQTQEYVYPAY